MLQHKIVVVIWCSIKYGGMIKGQIGMIGYFVKVKVQVKFTLEQATKAQRERR